MKVKTSLILILCVTLTSCSDPYGTKINGKLTPAQAEKLAENLPDKDRDLFLRWSQRDAVGEKFGGEGSVQSVKDAISTQVEYEARKAKEFEQRAAERAAAEKIEQAKQEKLEAQRQQVESYGEHRRRVHELILNSISSKALSYGLETQFNSYNQPTGQQWVFKIEVKNNTEKEIIGLAGYITIRDAFGNNLGSYPFKFETRLGQGKTVIQSLWMQDDPRDRDLRRLREAKTIFPEWFMESLAFADGSRIDEKTVPRTANIPTQKNS